MTEKERELALYGLKVNNSCLHTVVDENNNKIADWYIAEPQKGFVIDFMTVDPSKCRAILNLVLNELGAESEDKE